MKKNPKNNFLALLRGINVGGNNIIKMIALKQCFEGIGFTDVSTYIQSGNVIFSSTEDDTKKLESKIEAILSKTFSYKSTVVVVSAKDLQQIVKDAPVGFGKDQAKYRYDVLFLKDHLLPKEAIKEVKVREGVDEVHLGKGVLYFSRMISRATQSYLSKIVLLPIYKNMTIRNWNTTTKLLILMS